MCGRVSEWMGRRVDGCVDGWIDVWKVGRWVDGWVDGRLHYLKAHDHMVSLMPFRHVKISYSNDLVVSLPN
jgi:hypothetical protein